MQPARTAAITRWVTTGCGLKQELMHAIAHRVLVTRWVTTGCGLKRFCRCGCRCRWPRHPVGHHRVWIETTHSSGRAPMCTEVTRWVTTGCGLKRRNGLCRHPELRRHPVGHHRVWIETDAAERTRSISAGHPVDHHRVWIETGLSTRGQWPRLVTRWVTTGCELKPVTGCPICGMAQTEQATIKP